jgi:TolA-binding protein
VHGFPDSQYLPRALFMTAEYQLEHGRTDAARATLVHLATHYPMDALATLATRKIQEIDKG